MWKNFYLVLGVLMCFVLSGTAVSAQDSKQSTGVVSQTESKQWQEDLRFMASEAPKWHNNLFHTITPAQFDAAVKRLHERIPNLARHEIIVEMARIVATVGDGHTNIAPTRDAKGSQNELLEDAERLVKAVNLGADNPETTPTFAPLPSGARSVNFNAVKTQTNSIILVISKNDRTLSFVDPLQIKEIAKIPVPGGPHELAVSTDNRFAYLANYYQADEKLGHSISVIDIAARKEIKKIELGGLEMPHGIVELGGKLCFTSEHSRTVARYNTITDSVDWIRGTGQSLTHIPVVSPDGKRLYATDMNSDSVTMIDIEGSGQDAAGIKHIPVGSKPEGIAVSPDGKELWVGHNGDGGVSVIDTATLAVKKTFKAGRMPIRLKFTADGKRVVIVDPRTSEVIIYEAATAQEIKRIPVPGGPVSFAFSPDEKQIAVSLLNIAKAAIVDLENAKVLGTVSTGNVPDGIVWVKKS